MKLVSVIIPYYKNAHTILRAITSIRAQSYKNIQIIIVDDYSPDSKQLLVILKKNKDIIYFRNYKNMGQSKSRNIGVDLADGEIIAFLDADDEYHPKKIELQLDIVTPDIAVTCGTLKLLNNNSSRKYINHKVDFNHDFALLNKNILNGAGLMIYKEIFLELEGYNSNIRGNEDWDLWLRIITKKIKIVSIPKALYLYYENTEGISSNINEISDWEIKVLNLFLDNNKQFIPRYKKNIMYFIRLMSHISRYEKTKDNNLRNQIIIEISANQYLNLFTRTLLKIFLKFNFLVNFIYFFNKFKNYGFIVNDKFLSHQISFDSATNISNDLHLKKFIKPKCVAIVGSTGYVGKALVKRCLINNWKVKVLARRPNDWLNYPELEIYHGDFLKKNKWDDFLTGVDVVINCAGELTNKELMLDVNLKGPTKLLEQSVGKISRWVQLSSVGAYESSDDKIINEKTKEVQTSFYEKTKGLFDNRLRKKSLTKGFEVVILRPSIIYGSDMTNQSLFHFIRSIQKKLFFYIGNPNNYYVNYVHINDVVNALMLSTIHPKAKNKTFILSQYLHLQSMIEIITVKLKISTIKLQLPYFVVLAFVFFFSWFDKFPLKLSRFKALTNNKIFSSNEIKKDLDFKFKISFKKGIFNFIDENLM